MRLSMGEVAAILGASCGPSDRILQGFSIDSRTISPGELFFAIRGSRLDGHQFVRQALERGAAAAMVERTFLNQVSPPLACSLLPVDDTTKALQDLARHVRRKWGKRLIAVTGSTGKTTTKELIAALLAKRLSVHKSPGNLNNHFGLPLALLALEPRHEVAVVELAMSAAGEITRLARIAEPEVGVVTNVAPVHLEFFDSVDSIARAKRELIENLTSPATAVLNYDDIRVRKFAEGFTGQVVTFGFEQGADIRAVSLRARQTGGTAFQVIGARISGDFSISMPGRHNVENALAAFATASLFDIRVVELQRALSSFQNLPQRNEIVTLPGGITLIDDSYNSNPLAMERMLETLAAWPEARRRIVIAGEMLELGSTSPEWHRKVGRKCVECGVDWLLAVQGAACYFLEGAAAAGLPGEHRHFFSRAEEAAEYGQELLQPGDVVLVKGSRSVHLEKVAELLEAGRMKSPVPPLPEAGQAD